MELQATIPRGRNRGLSREKRSVGRFSGTECRSLRGLNDLSLANRGGYRWRNRLAVQRPAA